MAQLEQTRIYFDVTTEGERAGYVDTAAAMTAANHKQYHHVSRDGHALCYRLLVTAIKGSFTIHGAPLAFPTANAVKKTTAGWRAQLRHSGVKMKDLPVYGKRPRFALDRFGAQANLTAFPGEIIFENSGIHLHPLQAPGGAKWFSDYEASDGTDVQYKGMLVAAANSIAANQVTQVTVTDQTATPETSSQLPLVLLGASSTFSFSAIAEWMKSRRGMDSFSEETPGIEADSAMANLFSISEEYSDEVIGGVEEYMDWRPYRGDEALNSPWIDPVQFCVIDSVTSAAVQYPPGSAIIDVPLGLFAMTASAEANLQVDVLAVYEM